MGNADIWKIASLQIIIFASADELIESVSSCTKKKKYETFLKYVDNRGYRAHLPDERDRTINCG
jgi:hypothetical protein